ncbi:polysaccharide pyruvyl transferase family protein [Nocardia sp. NPDC059180]|uniref:polysaccharide pyruvyl transferase family protein n=1 Tax=Nocardia sp. NPDC059180 TaxID=3346761 RepID=UPI0036C4EF51
MGKSEVGAGRERFRVLIDNGEYWLRNRGDIAMMAVTVERLRQHWPRARIGMLTCQPAILRTMVPAAEPIDAARPWGRRGRLPGWVGSDLVGPAALRWRAATEAPKSQLRAVRAAMVHGQQVPPPAPGNGPGSPIPAAADSASLVLALGGGYMTDVDLYQAHRTLDLLEYAQRRGVPTAMIGQGLGPMQDQRLFDRAAAVLPLVDFIALRESRRGPDLLRRLGVAQERVMITGDDAVEFGYRMRRADVGTDIGLCLRVADYARIGDRAREILGAVVRARAADLGAGITPLIISEYDDEDRRWTLPLLRGATRVRAPIGRAGTAQAVAEQVGRCRILVTSVYHLAVFALAQGIPAVCVTASQYYDDKFYGLADMFGAGTRIVHLDDEALAETLTEAIDELWQSAVPSRVRLRCRASEQIEASRAGLRRVFALVDASAPEARQSKEYR